MMSGVRHISLRTLALAVAGMMAGVAVLALALTAHFFRQAAFAAQHQTMSKVVALASSEALRHLDARLFDLGSEFQERPEFRAAVSASLNADDDGGKLAALLEDPFRHGFADMRQVDLAKLRVYGPDLRLLSQNRSALDLPQTLSPVLLHQARGRAGAERLKALSALWVADRGAFYSVLLPIGGLRVLGYLEVVADPTFNLQTVAAMTGMPLSILDARGKLLYQSAANDVTGTDRLEIEYALRDQAGGLALRLVSRAEVGTLNAQLTRTTLIAIGVVIGLIVIATIIVYQIFNRMLLRPVAAMQVEMDRCAAGDLSVTVGRGTLMELNTLVDAFNAMARQLAAKVEELLHLSHVDSLTGLANRHHFDQCLEKEWRRALRNRTPLALLLIDVDHFKLYNDHYGHVAGDECLRAVAATIGKIMQRSTDLPAR
jgi:HAMP domain-containing protein